MSTPRSGLPPDQEGPGRLEDDPVPPGQTAPEAVENDDINSGSIASTETSGSASAVDALREVLRSLKKPPGVGTTRGLCNDGVIRIMIWLPTPDDEPTRIGVYDARPLSPAMIKAYLDRKPWVQEVEDRFRGVDGRDVPQEQWLNPPPGVLPSPGTKNERKAAVERSREERKKLEEKIARGEIEEGDLGPACGSVLSNYNLDPR